MDKVKTIIYKEWAEVFKNRLVLSITAFLPLFMAILPILMLWLYERFPEDMNSLNSGGDQFLEIFSETCASLSEMECLEVYTLSLFMFMFMILPVAIPVTIAAYSVVGEKTTHSLEPLLATPITTLQLLAGKAIAAMAPAILATWISYIIFLIGTRLMVDNAVFAQLIDPMWLLAIFIVGPLLALLAVCFSLMVSARVSDPRVAEQLSALIIMPLILLVIGQSVGLILINTQIILIIGIIVTIFDVILLMITVQLFERETILTRWK